MNQEQEERILIHEAIGHVWITSPRAYQVWVSDLTTQDAHDDLVKKSRFQSGRLSDELAGTFWQNVPDYHNDYWAMYNVEKWLFENKHLLITSYIDHLRAVVGQEHPLQYWPLVNASSDQRARAFVAMWKEQQ